MTKRIKFENWLKEHSRFVEVGSFTNEFGELFVIYRYTRHPHYLYITGDELDWKPKLKWFMGREVGKDGYFLLNIEETIQALTVLKEKMGKPANNF